MSLGPPRQRGLLALLAVRAGEDVHRAELIEALWGARAPVSAVGLVHTYVSRLRRVLEVVGERRDGGGVLVSAGRSYRLAAGTGELDWLGFRELVRRAGGTGDAVGRRELFGRALGLWRGQPMAEVEELRRGAAAALLDREWAAAVGGYARAALDAGTPDRAVPALRELTRRDPLNEHAHALLMDVLAAGGEQAAALAVYTAVRERLDGQLGIRPGAELAEAHLRVRRRERPPVRAARVWFGVLGPLSARFGKAVLPVGAARSRVLLATLLTSANRVVPVDDLAEVLWDGRPPAGAHTTVRSYVKRLRAGLGEVPGRRVVTRRPGYLIELSDDELDLLTFSRLSRAGGEALRAGDRSRAADLLTEALALWRGEPLGDVGSDVLQRAHAPHLRQARLQAVEWRIEADLHLGRHDESIPELQRLVEAHPLRERFGAQLMVALARSGRQAEALGVYRRFHRTLAEELGLEPGMELRRAHRQVLTGETGGGGGGRRVVPRQLPPAAVPFVGRVAELSELDGLRERDRGAATVLALVGAAGVGKTALAVSWAHRIAGEFPDGQLYLNLRGFGPGGTPVPSSQALRALLTALGVGRAEVPAGRDAQAGLYRSLLADRRMLIVLDNARDAQQVRALLPASPGCLTLVTSRNRLSGLVAADGAHPVELDVLTAAESEALLSGRLGARRVAAEPAAVGALVDACGRLPLALCVLSARAASQPGWALAVLADQVRVAGARLDAFSTTDATASVRSVLSWSYRWLDRDAATLFRLLGLHPGPDVTVPAAASLAGTAPELARAALDRLCEAHLLHQSAPGRYGCHDLLRAYAAELVRDTEDDGQRRAATHRMLDHYLHTAHAADRLLNPTRDPLVLPAPRAGVLVGRHDGETAALGWFDAEHAALVAVTTAAAGSGWPAHAWQLAWLAGTFLHWRGHWQTREALLDTALVAARESGDRLAEARVLRDQGATAAMLRQHPRAEERLRDALRRYLDVGDRVGAARVHRDLGWVRALRGRYQEALVLARQALEEYRRVGHRAGEADSLNAVGWYESQLGEPGPALDSCRQALALYRGDGDRQGQADTSHSLGGIHRRLGQYPEALASYRRALALWQQVGARYGEAETLVGLGDTHQAAGDPAAARVAWRRACAILDELGHPEAGALRARLAGPEPTAVVRRVTAHA